MRFRRLSLSVLALAALLSPARADVLPAIKAETLNKAPFAIPASFTAERNVLLFSFGRDMQAAVDAWDAALATLRADPAACQVYNMPLIPNPGGIVRGFISGGMRGIYKDPAQRDRVVVLYIDESKVMPALKVGDRTAPLVLVADREGRELGRVQGPASGANVAAVRALAGR
jgi:hypothetical protein